MIKLNDKHTFEGKKIGVAMGGESSERAISLKTGRAFVSALQSLGYDVAEYDIATDLPRLASEAPAAVLLGVHGGIGENGVLQGFLEAVKIPYTGSGPLASALAMDKARAKAVMADAGAPVAGGVRLTRDEAASIEKLSEVLAAENLSFPLVIKLNDGGSSVGVYLCRDLTAAFNAVEALRAMLDSAASAGILVERYLAGAEYSVGFSDEEFLGAIQIVPEAEFYDFQAKYESTSTDYRYVEDVMLLDNLQRVGRLAYNALGCRGVARVDVKADAKGELFVLEVNTIPGMTETSLVPKLAARKGLSFAQFVEWMLDSAACEMSDH